MMRREVSEPFRNSAEIRHGEAGFFAWSELLEEECFDQRGVSEFKYANRLQPYDRFQFAWSLIVQRGHGFRSETASTVSVFLLSGSSSSSTSSVALDDCDHLHFNRVDTVEDSKKSQQQPVLGESLSTEGCRQSLGYFPGEFDTNSHQCCSPGGLVSLSQFLACLFIVRQIEN